MWLLLAASGCFWLLSRCFWRCLAVSGCVWLLLAASFRLLLTASGCFWLLVAASGCFGLRLAKHRSKWLLLCSGRLPFATPSLPSPLELWPQFLRGLYRCEGHKRRDQPCFGEASRPQFLRGLYRLECHRRHVKPCFWEPSRPQFRWGLCRLGGHRRREINHAFGSLRGHSSFGDCIDWGSQQTC